jgi:major membrane immunogen (membrane-anchored lipoprotein)
VIVGPRFRDVTADVFSTADPGRMFALFRHPVDRAVSMYYYLARASWDPYYNPALSKMTVEQYAKSGHIENNWMTRFLVNKPGGTLGRGDMLLAKRIIKTKCLVGLYEDIEVSLSRFVRFFGWEQPRGGGGNSTTAPRSAADAVGCRSEAVARGDRYVSGKSSVGGGVGDMATVRPGSLAWNAIVRMNLFDLELYEYAKRVYQMQAEGIFDVVGYELPPHVVAFAASSAGGIGNAAPVAKSMDDGTTSSASFQSGKKSMEFDDADGYGIGIVAKDAAYGGESAAAAADLGSGKSMSKDADAIKSMAKDGILAEDAIKSMAKNFVEVGGQESTNIGTGNKVMGDAVNAEQAALRMGDVVGAEYEAAPTAKKMSVDADGVL